MNKPLTNELHEKFAQDIAEAIGHGDGEKYQQLRDENIRLFENMTRNELLKFRDRVHFLAGDYQ